MIEQLLLRRLKPIVRRAYDSVDTPPILDMDRYFPAHRELEAQYQAIRDEALAIYQDHDAIPRFHEISATQTRISASDGKNWRMFMVKSYRYLIRPNADMTPTLTRFLAAHPEVTTAAISFLDPGKHIPAHTGPFRGILRYHICLFAPDTEGTDGPWLRVDNQTIPYREGEGLLWDDTYDHEVLNPGPNPRVALLLDVRRPVSRYLHRAIFRWVMIGGYVYSALNAAKMRATATRNAA
jgi:aspartate beta-hydroxylase